MLAAYHSPAAIKIFDKMTAKDEIGGTLPNLDVLVDYLRSLWAFVHSTTLAGQTVASDEAQWEVPVSMIF